MRSLVLAGLMAVVLCGSTTGRASSTAKGECLLTVEGKKWLDGSCNISIGERGGFEIDNGNAMQIFVVVDIDEDHVATGYWNGAEHASHAHDALGILSRDGGCWSNKTARVCAWRPGTRPR